MDAACELAQLVERSLELDLCLTQQPRSGAAFTNIITRQLQRHADCEQALLRPVVQVPLGPAALGVAGLHDPGPGGTYLLELGTELRV